MIRRTLFTRVKGIEGLIGLDQKAIIHDINFVDETGAVVEAMRIMHGGTLGDRVAVSPRRLQMAPDGI